MTDPTARQIVGISVFFKYGISTAGCSSWRAETSRGRRSRKVSGTSTIAWWSRWR